MTSCLQMYQSQHETPMPSIFNQHVCNFLGLVHVAGDLERNTKHPECRYRGLTAAQVLDSKSFLNC